MIWMSIQRTKLICLQDLNLLTLSSQTDKLTVFAPWQSVTSCTKPVPTARGNSTAITFAYKFTATPSIISIINASGIDFGLTLNAFGDFSTFALWLTRISVSKYWFFSKQEHGLSCFVIHINGLLCFSIKTNKSHTPCSITSNAIIIVAFLLGFLYWWRFYSELNISYSCYFIYFRKIFKKSLFCHVEFVADVK